MSETYEQLEQRYNQYGCKGCQSTAIDVCKDILDLFCLNEDADIKRLYEKAKKAIKND